MYKILTYTVGKGFVVYYTDNKKKAMDFYKSLACKVNSAEFISDRIAKKYTDVKHVKIA